MKKVQSPLIKQGNRVSAQLCWLMAPSSKSVVEQDNLTWEFPVREDISASFATEGIVSSLKSTIPGAKVQVLSDQATLAVASEFYSLGQQAQIICRCTGTASKPTITVEAKFL